MQAAAAVYITLLRVPGALQMGEGAKPPKPHVGNEYFIINVLLSDNHWLQILNSKQ